MTPNWDPNSTGELRPEDLQSGFLVGAGRFTLDRTLRPGARATVWKATDNQLNEPAALKFFASELANPATLSALRSTVQLARKLSHPHIARTHDLYLVAGELPFVATEFIEGLDLDSARRIRPDGIFSWAELHPLLQQVCAALEYAHREGIVHGGLEPDKIMLDLHERVKVLGFGTSALSRSLLPGRESSAAPALLPYSTPQLLDGNPATPADDIYSLAVAVYELLTGRPSFWNGDVPHQILTARTPRISEHAFENGVANAVPPYVEDLWFAALSRDPGTRPNATQLCVALAAGEPASPPEDNPSAFEPISLIPPSPITSPPPRQKTAAEEAQDFESAIPLEVQERETSSDTFKHRGVLILIGAVLLIALAAVWHFATSPKTTTYEIRADAPQENSPTNNPSANGTNRSLWPGLTVLNLGDGPSFTYQYRPQQALALDTNAINHGVKFLRETGDRANCCFIMTQGQTNHSVGTITYDLRTEPGFVVQDLRVSQSTAHYTHGRIRGEFSLDQGRTFHPFFLTPPYQGKSFGHGGSTNLSSLYASNVVLRYTIHRYSGNDYNLQFLRDCNDHTSALRFSGSIIKAEM